MSANKIIQAFARKTLTKNQGSGITTIPNQFVADSKAGEILTLLKNAGLPINQLDDYIRTEADLLKFLNLIENASKPRVIPGTSAEGKAITEKLFGKKGEVVDMTGKKMDTSQGIMGGKSVKELMESGQVQKGTDGLKVSEKVTEREMFKNSNLNKPKVDTVTDTITYIKSLEPIDAMKEANSVIGRKGKYKNLTPEESKKILQDTADHIFERDIPDEDFAKGGRAGFYTGGMIDVEPNLSDIGHGSDALMASTRLVSPNGQATTSTGLNYLLAEDNDNIRVPFAGGYNVPSHKDYLKQMETVLHKHFKRYKKIYGGKMKFNEFATKFIREDAEGGRIGFKDGGMGRRAFLKLLAALGGGIAAAKSGILSLGGKGAAKKALPAITTPNAPGKPEWFDALVTRIIREGDDVTKTMSTKERQNIYRKKIDDETEVTVTQDLDNNTTTVDIDDSVRNVTGFDDPPTVSLQVTDEIVEEGGMRTKPQFKATENDYRNYATDPDGGYETEFVENTVENTKDLTSDLTKIKSFATNKKETMKEFVESKKRKDNVKYAQENPSSYAADRGPDYDPSDYIDDMADDMATGGRAGFSGGGGKFLLSKLGITGSSRRFLEKVFGKGSLDEMLKRDPGMHRGLLEVVEMFRNRDKEGLKMYMQKFLPHMDDKTVEAFIKGDAADAAGQGKYGLDNMQGQLIRLGSGRDYKGKLEAMQKLENAKKLDTLDVTEEMIRKPNASGGLQTLLGE